MGSNPVTVAGAGGVWRWLLVILGVNVFLILAGFLVPASDEQIHSAAIRHLLQSQLRYPTTAYVWTEAELSPEVRQQLSAFASSWDVHLVWEGEFASVPPDFVESVEETVRISFGMPERGIGLTRLRVGISSAIGGRASEVVLFHWMGIGEVWKEAPVLGS